MIRFLALSGLAVGALIAMRWNAADAARENKQPSYPRIASQPEPTSVGR